MSTIKVTADSGGGSVALKAPASTTSNADVELKLPVADGSANQHLKTDGSGQLGWVTEGVGGKILQVISISKTDTASATADSGGETSEWMSQAITPSAATSKILIIIHANIGTSGGSQVGLRLRINGSTPDGGTGNGQQGGTHRRYLGTTAYINGCTSCMVGMGYSYLHSPSTTSSITYGFNTLHSSASSKTMYINRSHDDTDAATQHRAMSTLTLMEIGA